MSPTLLVIAAVLLAALGVLHSILGERLIIRSLVRRDDLPPVLGGQAYTAGVIRFAWHITSILAIGLAAVLAVIASGSDWRAIVIAIGVTCLACAVLPVISTRGRHVSWAVFLAAGVLCLAAAIIG